MKQVWQLIGATVLSASVAESAQAIPLSTLLSGGTLGAGGLAFTNFSASFRASDPLRIFDPAAIDVTALAGGPAAGTWLRFEVGGGALTVRGEGGGAPAFAGLQMRFRAAALDPARAGAVLAAQGNAIDMRLENRGVYVGDAAGSPGIAGPVALPGAPWNGNSADWYFPLGAVPAVEAAGFPSQPELWIHKDALVWATDRAHTVSLLVFSQRFDLEVPEPGSLPLLAVAGLAAAAVLGKKRLAR